MGRSSDQNIGRSIKMLIIYGFLVLLIVIIAVMVRIVAVVNESKFDNKHRFTMAIGKEERVTGLISFEPATYSIGMLFFTPDMNVSFSDLNSRIGVIPDGRIKYSSDIDTKIQAASITQALLLRWNEADTTFTFYDMLRFWFYSTKIPASSVTRREVSNSTSIELIDKYSSILFNDSLIIKENVSIQIVNASGVDGLAGRLGRVIGNFGGNVVSVETSAENLPRSKIRYSGDESYTLQRLRNLLGFKAESLESKAIAEIVIVLGEDSKATGLF